MKKYIYWFIHDKLQRLNNYLWRTSTKDGTNPYPVGTLIFKFAFITNKSLNKLRYWYKK